MVKKRPTHLIPTWDANGTSSHTTDYGDLEFEMRWPIDASTQPERQTETGNDTGVVEQSSVPDDSHDNLNAHTKRCDGPVQSLSLSSYQPPSNGGPMGVGSTQDSGFSNNCENGANFSGAGFSPECRIGRGGSRKRCDGISTSDTISILSHSPEPCRPRALKKGDHVAFKGKEPDDVEWFSCKLLRRAGRAKGKYSVAWNISRDGHNENIDFERDVGEYRLIHNTAIGAGEPVTDGISELSDDKDEDNVTTPLDMNAHLEALLHAAIQREEGDSSTTQLESEGCVPGPKPSAEEDRGD